MEDRSLIRARTLCKEEEVVEGGGGNFFVRVVSLFMMQRSWQQELGVRISA